MNVLFITRKYPPSTGGMELFAYDLSNALAKKTNLTLVKWGRQGRWKSVIFGLPYLFIASAFNLFKKDIDVIHLNDGVLAPMGLILSKLFKKPFVVVINGMEATYDNPIYKIIVPGSIKKADAIACISRATAEAVREGLEVDESKVHLINVAINDVIYGKSTREDLISRLGLAKDSQVLLSVGRLVTRKGVAWFINHVLPDLVRRYPKLVYLVIGDGDDYYNVERAVVKQNLGKKVKLLGQVDNDTLMAAYNGADIFVMPNIRVPGDMEGFGLVLIEAALAGRPVVASNLEGIKDAVVDGKNGILVSPGNRVAFTEQISGFLDDPGRAAGFGQKARRYTLRKYKWSAVAGSYVKLYKTLR